MPRVSRLTNKVMALHVGRFVKGRAYMAYAVKDLDRGRWIRCSAVRLNPKDTRDPVLPPERLDATLRAMLDAFRPGYLVLLKMEQPIPRWHLSVFKQYEIPWRQWFVRGWLECVIENYYKSTLTFTVREKSVLCGNLLTRTAKQMKLYYPDGNARFSRPAERILNAPKQREQVFATAMIRYWQRRIWPRVPENLRLAPSETFLKFGDEIDTVF